LIRKVSSRALQSGDGNAIHVRAQELKSTDRHTISADLKAYAVELGFTLVSIVAASPSPYLAAYLRWIEAGMHGSMGYMAREDRVTRRKDLNVILPGARSLIVVGLDYASAQPPDHLLEDPARGRISNYAWGIDYHDLLLERLEMLNVFLRDRAGADVKARAYVDTGAILERSHAAEGNVGFVGKNTMLIHPRRGSYFFLGEIITDAELAYDPPPDQPKPGCGTCTRCLTACPTSAFPQPYVLDARLCISYLTIEHKGFILRDLRPKMGNWVYGCDVCQAVCPWQRFVGRTKETAFLPRSTDRCAPPLSELLTLDEAAFAWRYKDSAIFRIRRDRLVRNACVAAGNSGQAGLSKYLLPLIDDHSPLVRGHAVWALGRLGAGFDVLNERLTVEADEDVRRELALALRGE
jgi:epoxyqueuosine reductase